MTAGSLSLRALLERPVTLNGIRLGLPAEAVLDGETLRVVGLDVDCTDARPRFLPLAAARIHADAIAVGSALILLDGDARAFYRRRSRPFASLLGAPVARGGKHVGALSDLLIRPDGTVEAIVAAADGPDGGLHAPADVTVAAAPRVSAA